MISIILPNYNHSEFLDERLHSILNQTFEDYELIILDDASTDGSLKILELFRNHPKVSHFIINSVNSGSPFKQWEKGLSLAKGEFIWIAESDDYCDLNFLETQIKTISNLNCDIAVSMTIKIGLKKQSDEIHHPIFQNSNVARLNKDFLNYCPVLNVSAIVFRRGLCSNSNFYKGFNLIGDRVFYYESFNNKLFAKNIHTNAYFRKNDKNLSNLNHKEKHYLIKYFIEHHRFIDYVFEQGELSNLSYNSYLNRFFNRIRDRIPRYNKISFSYLHTYFQYKKSLKNT